MFVKWTIFKENMLRLTWDRCCKPEQKNNAEEIKKKK